MEFIVAPDDIKEVRYHKIDNYKNISINVLTLISVKSSIERWYPDNEGTPSIVFQMQGTVEPIVWIIPKSKYGFSGAQKIRDLLLKQIEDGNTKPLIY